MNTPHSLNGYNVTSDFRFNASTLQRFNGAARFVIRHSPFVI